MGKFSKEAVDTLIAWIAANPGVNCDKKHGRHELLAGLVEIQPGFTTENLRYLLSVHRSLLHPEFTSKL